MNQIRIGLREDRKSFEPGEEIAGAAGWEFASAPRTVEVRLFWFTRGKGTEDAGVVATVRFDHPKPAEARPFQFQLPREPHSFSGKLISLIWAVEAVALPSNQSARAEFVLAPQGKEILLHAGA